MSEEKKHPTTSSNQIGWVTVRVEDTGDGLIINAEDAKEWRLVADQHYEGHFLPDGKYRIAIPRRTGKASPVSIALGYCSDCESNVETHDGRWSCGSGRVVKNTPVSIVSVDPALINIAETMKESGGGWRACSGCYDTEDGHPTQKYDYSPALQTDIGFGCHECGGLGARWEYYSDQGIADMLADETALSATATEGE